MDDGLHARIESIRIRGFRSLADVQVTDLPPVAVLMICRHVGRILPGFDGFVLEERCGKVFLQWSTRHSAKTFGAHLTSDGSLRFFALVTLLDLPPAMLPDVILLDEPELGMHPTAVDLVAEMVKAVGHTRQAVVATQHRSSSMRSSWTR